MNESDNSRINTILNFENTILESIEWNDLKEVQFAMWLPTEEDSIFEASPIMNRWNTAYSITQHYWSYITADLLRILKLVSEETRRLGLPDDFQVFPFLTTDNEQVILSLSKEKGIRFHFARTTPLAYRLQFMDNFIMYCNSWKELVDTHTGNQDDDLEFSNWWNFTVETSISVEKKEPLTGVGVIAR
ncbi:hypothetical protein [Flavobacterium cerinum]|uniref:Phytochrome chromophore attachment site domain-containing protein n=1 Tax=Flavobacterium cerinum TaxID=2502784 RepID=A0ABY5IRB0_9FLAO|nr:hypothetical protein [Flavobacterium cerinum]UUC44816.1 hypothetical protein NOX80_14415 [Flavobacterium cerinum]